jgi:hypothetical protein
MKIKTTNEHIANAIVNFPIVGHQQITNGEIDIQDDVAELLLQADDWDIVSDEEVVTIPENTQELGESREAIEDISDKIVETPKTKVIKKKKKESTDDELDGLSLEELLDIAKEGGVKNYHLFKNKPEGLKSLIRKSLSKQ